MNNSIRRSDYLQQLSMWRDKQVIKVITGVRRSGKSTLMLQFQDDLKADGVEAAQIQSINFEDLAFEHLLLAGTHHSLSCRQHRELGFRQKHRQQPAGGWPEYYQVSLSVRDAATLERELTPLKRVSDHFPKHLLTLDNDPVVFHDGVRQVYALDWLLETESPRMVNPR